MQGLQALSDLSQFALVPLDILVEAVDPEFRQMELGTDPEELFVPLGDQRCGFFSDVLYLFEFVLKPCDLFVKLGDFTPVSQEAPVGARAAPARQDATRADDVALRRDEGAAETVLPLEGDSFAEIRDEENVSQQFIDDRPAILPDLDLFDQRNRLLEMLVLREGGAGSVGPDLERNEAPPAEGGFFQIVNRPDAVRLVLDHNILELVPQDRLDGRFVLPWDADVVGDEAQEGFTGKTRAS